MIPEIDRDYLRSVLNYDPITGEFRWKAKTNGRVRVGMIAGKSAREKKHIQIRVRGRMYLAHRLAWLYCHGVWPHGQLDHINCDRFDNRIANLRIATHAQNCANRHALTGLKGASRATNGKWQARISINGVQHYLGLFDTAEEANSAYRAKATEAFGEFARW